MLSSSNLLVNCKWWILFLGMAMMLPSRSYGQLPLEEGESVKILFVGEIIDATIIARDKNRYNVQFTFANQEQTKVFERAQIRKLCEVNAIDFAKVWASSNGKFKIEAALKSFEGDKVKLVKTDETEIDVPIASLSDKDKAYLSKFKKQYDEAVKLGQVVAKYPSLPPIDDYGVVDPESFSVVVGEGKVSELGSMPSYLTTFEQSGLGFKLTRQRQKLVAAIPIGGPEQLVLMTAVEDNFFNNQGKFQAEAYWASLKQKKILASVPLPPDEQIVDYDPRFKRMVSINYDQRRDQGSEFGASQGEKFPNADQSNGDQPKEEERNSITLWNLKPGDTKAEAVARWATDYSPFVFNHFIKIVSENIVLAKVAQKSYVAWDVSAKKVVYTFKSGNFFDAPIVLSPDRKSLILPEDGKVTVLDSTTGELKFSLPVAARHVSGVCVNADGNKLAALTEQNVFVWDLASGSEQAKSYEAPLIGSPAQSRLEWVSDDLLLAASHMERVLYRLSLELPVWSYRMGVREQVYNNNPLFNSVLGGLLFYIAIPDPLGGGVAVGAVKLPGPKADEITEKIDRDTLMLIKPGTRVSIDASKTTDAASVEKWLEEKVKANGWVYDRSAPIRLVAEMGVGERQSETYSQMGGGGGNTTVSFTPHYANLIIRQGDAVLWQSGTSTGPPPIIRGDNLQAEVSKTERPQLGFFQFVSIPNKIIDPKYSRGFGVSELGLRGIEVLSTSPPGREADPSAADRKMQQDRLNPSDKK